MARRNGRPGNYLMTDDYTGQTRYASELKRDFWGAYAVKPYIRNLQEIASPLSDPAPVPIYRGPDYESFDPCVAELAPIFVGNTTVRTNNNNAAIQVLNLNPAIPAMIIGCTFEVR